MPTYHQYSRWDGTQDIFGLQPDELMEELSDYLLAHGDISRALRQMMHRGLKSKTGDDLQGIQNFLQQLRALRQQNLDRYDLSSIMEDLKQRLDDVLQKERQGISDRLEETRQGAKETGQDDLLKALEHVAQKNLSFLDSLPQDMAGAIKELTNYDFLDPEAKREFDEMMEMLQQRMLESFLQDLKQQLQSLTPEDLARMKQMVQEMNRMLQEKGAGGKPDFQQFMEQYGDLFGPEAPQSLEEFIEQMQQRRSQMQSLLDSMPSEQRQALQDILNSIITEEGLREQLSLLAANLEYHFPAREMRRRYPFHGDESLTFSEAMDLMERLQNIDELERQLKGTLEGKPLDNVDVEKLREILGEDAYQSLKQLKQLAEMLEKAGYIKRKENYFELTPRGIRRIGQKALKDIFNYIKKGRLGRHEMPQKGLGGDRVDDTRLYRFGDPFLLDLQKTVMNALVRDGAGVPVRIKGEDFEVYETEYLTQCSTVLMLDMSLSMTMRGAFVAAKKVALALDSLIHTQFPRDQLFIVGFGRYARELKRDALPYAAVDEFAYGTNMQHGFMLSQKLLSRSTSGNKQIIMISDGEPTAHMEAGHAYFQYPPSPKTVYETLREARRCAQKGILINVFMLERDFYLMEFVSQLTKINRGRVFYTSPEKLGQYIVVDYLSNKRRKIAS